MFYGFKSKEDEQKFAQALAEIQKIYPSYYMNDMLCTFLRCMSFAKEQRFQEAFFRNATSDIEMSRLWRLHVLAWSSSYAFSLPKGDMIECGTFNGFTASVVVDYLGTAIKEKGIKFHLFDTFEGVPEKYSTEEERTLLNPQYKALKGDINDLYEYVVERFKDVEQVQVHKGILPDILRSTSIEGIRFLHMDLNVAEAESLTLEELFPKIVPGGVIILDDYGHIIHGRLHVADSMVVKKFDHQILELPTGQGLVIKGGANGG